MAKIKISSIDIEGEGLTAAINNGVLGDTVMRVDIGTPYIAHAFNSVYVADIEEALQTKELKRKSDGKVYGLNTSQLAFLRKVVAFKEKLEESGWALWDTD